MEKLKALDTEFQENRRTFVRAREFVQSMGRNVNHEYYYHMASLLFEHGQDLLTACDCAITAWDPLSTIECEMEYGRIFYELIKIQVHVEPESHRGHYLYATFLHSYLEDIKIRQRALHLSNHSIAETIRYANYTPPNTTNSRNNSPRFASVPDETDASSSSSDATTTTTTTTTTTNTNTNTTTAVVVPNSDLDSDPYFYPASSLEANDDDNNNDNDNNNNDNNNNNNMAIIPKKTEPIHRLHYRGASHSNKNRKSLVKSTTLNTNNNNNNNNNHHHHHHHHNHHNHNNHNNNNDNINNNHNNINNSDNIYYSLNYTKEQLGEYPSYLPHKSTCIAIIDKHYQLCLYLDNLRANSRNNIQPSENLNYNHAKKSLNYRTQYAKYLNDFKQNYPQILNIYQEIFRDQILREQISIEDYYRYADFLEKINYHSKALEMYEEGLNYLKKNPQDGTFNNENAMGLVLCYVQLMIACKQFESVYQYLHYTLYRDIFQQNPADFYWFLSMFYVSRSQYLIALYCCDECIGHLYRYEQEEKQNNPNANPQNNRSKLLNIHLVHFRKSLIYHKIKEFKSSLQVMESINSFCEQVHSYQAARGDMHRDVLQYDKALESYKKAIRYEKRYPSSVYGDIGYVYSCMMNEEQANRYWNLAVKKKLSEDTIRVYSEYGFHLFWSFRLKEAIQIFDQVIEYKSEKLTNDLYIEDGAVVYDRKKWLEHKHQQQQQKNRTTTSDRHDSHKKSRSSSRSYTSKRITEFLQSLWSSKKEKDKGDHKKEIEENEAKTAFDAQKYTEAQRKDEVIYNGLANSVQENIYMCIYFRSLALMHFYKDWDSVGRTSMNQPLLRQNQDDTSGYQLCDNFDPVEYGFRTFFASFMHGAVVSIATADYILYKAHYQRDFESCKEIYHKHMQKLMQEEEEERKFIWNEWIQNHENDVSEHKSNKHESIAKKPILIDRQEDDENTIHCKKLLLEDQYKFEHIMEKNRDNQENRYFENYRISEKSRLEVTYAYALSLEAREKDNTENKKNNHNTPVTNYPNSNYNPNLNSNSNPNPNINSNLNSNYNHKHNYNHNYNYAAKERCNHKATQLFEKWYDILRHGKHNMKCDLFGLRGSWCLHHFYATHLHYNLKALSLAKQQYLYALECCPRHIWTLFHYTQLLVEEDFENNKNIIKQQIHLMKEINVHVDLMKSEFDDLCKHVEMLETQ